MQLHEAVAVTYAAMGQELTDAALTVIVGDMENLPLPSVLAALQRCRKELRRISLSDILERIPGGHPGAEEAWAIVAPALSDERISLVWTDEMSQAFGVALNLSDDPVAARMAFKETYSRLIAEARDSGKPIKWTPSLGHDKQGRESALVEAVTKGRLTATHAMRLLPADVSPDVVAMIESKAGPIALPVERIKPRTVAL